MEKLSNVSRDSVAQSKSGCDNQVLSGLFSLPPAQYTLLSSIVGFLFIDGLDLSQQNSLGNFIVNIGQTILTAAAQGQLLQDKASQDDMQEQLQLLKQHVNLLEKRIR